MCIQKKKTVTLKAENHFLFLHFLFLVWRGKFLVSSFQCERVKKKKDWRNRSSWKEIEGKKCHRWLFGILPSFLPTIRRWGLWAMMKRSMSARYHGHHHHFSDVGNYFWNSGVTFLFFLILSSGRFQLEKKINSFTIFFSFSLCVSRGSGASYRLNLAPSLIHSRPWFLCVCVVLCRSYISSAE